MSETRFTERAQAALRLAQECSAELGHGYVGSEHLLLGLAREGKGVAAKVLQSAGLEPESLKAAIGSKVRELREQAREELAASEVQYDRVWELKREKRDKAFKVRKLSDGIFRVEGSQVERMVVQTDWENEEALAFLQHRFKRLGVDKALENAGARNGDEVRILGYAFEFESAAGIDDPYQELEL